jgi:hypothetical protein
VVVTKIEEGKSEGSTPRRDQDMVVQSGGSPFSIPHNSGIKDLPPIHFQLLEMAQSEVKGLQGQIDLLKAQVELLTKLLAEERQEKNAWVAHFQGAVKKEPTGKRPNPKRELELGDDDLDNEEEEGKAEPLAPAVKKPCTGAKRTNKR